MAELDVALRAGDAVGLLRTAHRIARDAATHVLIADLRRRDARTVALAAGREAQLAQHVVFHEWQEFVVALVLVMVSVDVDDDHVVEIALMSLLARMRQQPAGIEFFDR